MLNIGELCGGSSSGGVVNILLCLASGLFLIVALYRVFECINFRCYM